MYASDESIELSSKQILGINKLYKLFLEHNIINENIDISNYLIPSEYSSLRYQ